MQLPSAPPCQNKSNQFNMSYLKNISENSYNGYLCDLKYEITTPYDEFISTNISFQVFVILEFIINSYMPFGLILTKRPSFFNMFKSDKTFCLLVPYSKITKQFTPGSLDNSINVCNFINERKHIETYLMIDFSYSGFEILTDGFILNHLPKFKTIKELYLKTKLSGKPIPYRTDEMINQFKDESNKLIEESYDAPFLIV